MDRHLLPNEIDLLLDGEVGFGTSPLKTHIRRCAECRAELEEARALVQALEHLPRFVPAPMFAHRVMARVQVYVPWHVTLLDTLRGWVPQSRPARALAGAGALSMGAVLTLASLWIVARLDTFVFAAGLGLERVSASARGAVADAVAGALGEPALEALRALGWLGLAIAGVLLLVTTAGAASLLRGLATRSRAR
ncbi:MAG: hypothetical protein WKG32_01630 [Gemmatimonadaceae bacterium]